MPKLQRKEDLLIPRMNAEGFRKSRFYEYHLANRYLGRRASRRIHRLCLAHPIGGRRPGTFDAAPIAQPLAAFT